MSSNSTYTYGTNSEYWLQTYRPVLSTSHAGGADTWSLDDNGSVTNPLGQVEERTLLSIDDRILTTSVTDLATSNSAGTSVTYDFTPNTGAPEGFVYSRTERNGSVTTFERDDLDRVLTRTEDANGLAPRVTNTDWHNSTNWEVDQRLPMTRKTDKLRETWTYLDGTRHLPTTYTQTDIDPNSPNFNESRTWTYAYTIVGSSLRVLTSVDGPGLASNGVNDVSTYTYSWRGFMTSSTDPNGLVTTYTTSPMGQPSEMTLPDGIEWAFTYDVAGRMLTSTRDPNGTPATTSFVYDTVGQMLSFTNSLGNTWSFEYDKARRLTEVTSPDGDTAAYQYDAMGNVTQTEYSDGINLADFQEDISYDALGRMLQTVKGENQTWDYSHDLEDNLDVVTDPLSNTVDRNYDALNRMVEVIDQANYTTLTEHDVNDDITKYTDPRSLDTTFVYNGFGEVVSETSPDKGTTTYTYNTRGLVASMVDARGVTTTYEYDDGGRVTAKRFPATPSEDQTFTWDYVNGGNVVGRGKPDTTKDESGTTTTRYEQSTGFPEQQTRVIEGETYQIGLQFDSEGQQTQLTYPSNHELLITRDGQGRITDLAFDLKETDPGTGQPLPPVSIISNAGYLSNGPLSTMTYGDGALHTATHDKSYRLTGLTDDLGGTLLRDVDLTYTARDNIQSIQDTLNTIMSETYGYEAREKLASADGPYSPIAYTYDGVGNRLTKTTGGVADTYSYGLTDNRLASIAGGTTRSFTHDAAGNTTYDNQSGTGYGYTYNAANRMDTMSINGTVQAEYLYNALGQQVVRRLTQAGQTIHSIHDLDGNRIAEYDYDAGTGSSTLIREYIWMNGAPVGVVEGGQVFYIRTDHIARPVFATNDLGVKVWEASYLPFGGVHTSTGAIDLRFPGQWFQSESGLHQNWMRDYDPTTGRYIQADPLGLVDGASVYGYALQNPGRYVDRHGLNTTTIVLPPAGGSPGKDWGVQPNYRDPNPGSIAYQSNCSKARLEFHKGKSGANGWEGLDHWHYYPNGGGKTKLRYGFPGADHLPPGTPVSVPDCSCNSGGGGGGGILLPIFPMPGPGLGRGPTIPRPVF